jgi:hypothetical protein
MTTRTATAKATADFSASLRNDKQEDRQRRLQIPFGDDTRTATATATADFSGSLRNDKQKDWLGVRLGVPKGDCSGTGMVTELGFGEDFVGFAWWRSSILGIAGLCVMRHELRFWLMNGYLAREFQFGT